ncbi:MAG: alkaline phosphatase family protein [Planctomycetia bacterium]|nr:alkaline phosphatase family protein [Planctomycetia bacterium]
MSGLSLCVLLGGLAVFGADDKPLSRIGFGSCLRQDKPQPIWTPLLATRPELFLFLGDNIYADTTDIDVMREKYKQQSEKDGFKKLKALCPLLATWDDHDYGGNDAGASYPRKKESQQAFLDFFDVAADSPRRKQEGVYHAQVFGPPGKRVQVIMLDTRYHLSELKKGPRSGTYVPREDADASILGRDQWAWLATQFKVPAEVRLIGSSVQMVAEDHSFEKWANLPLERERFLRLVRDTRAGGVIVLSGDRHLAELSMLDGPMGYPLYDVTSSGMNQGNKRFRRIEPNKHRLAIQDVGDNFGLIRIDWTKSDPLVSLEIHDVDGDVVIRHKVPLSRLQPGTTNGDGRDLSAEARKHLGKTWTVEFTVANVGVNKTKSMFYLNSERDFRSDLNFPVVLNVKALGKEFSALGDPRKTYLGKKVKVTGTVSLFNGNPQIVIEKLSQIQADE